MRWDRREPVFEFTESEFYEIVGELEDALLVDYDSSEEMINYCRLTIKNILKKLQNQEVEEF